MKGLGAVMAKFLYANKINLAESCGDLSPQIFGSLELMFRTLSNKFGICSEATPLFFVGSSRSKGNTSGYRVRSSSYRARSTGYRVRSSSYRVRSSGYRARSTGYRVRSSGYRVRISGYRVSSSGYRISGGINARRKNLPEEAFRIQEPGVRRVLDSSSWILTPQPGRVSRLKRIPALHWHAPCRLCLRTEAAEPQSQDAPAEPGHQIGDTVPVL